MKLPTRAPEAPEINLTPLIDVVFLMLVFFVVTTTFDARQSLSVTLPGTRTGAPEPASPIVVVLAADGGLHIDGEPVVGGSDAIQRALTAARAGRAPDKRRVVIRADEDVRHGRVLQVMDQAGRSGMAEVSIATRERRETP
jgi:biopolymer transport protein ExbD